MSEGSDIPVKIRVMAVDEATSAFQKASAAAIQYEQKIAAYTQSKGANVQALKSMQGKLLTLQATKQQADAMMMQAQLEERLFQATHTHEQIMLRDLEQRLAVQRQMYASNAQMQALLTKTFEAEKGQIGTGLPGGMGKRELRHVLRGGAGMALGQGGGELGGIASMGMMIGGTAGVAIAGLMMIGEAYKSTVEAAKRLAEAQKDYNKDLRESGEWWAKETQHETTSMGGHYRDRARALREHAQEIIENAKVAEKGKGQIAKASEGWGRVFSGDFSGVSDDVKMAQRRAASTREEADLLQKQTDREETLYDTRQENARRWETVKTYDAGMKPGSQKQKEQSENAIMEGRESLQDKQADRRQKIEDEHEAALLNAKNQVRDRNKNYFKKLADEKYEKDKSHAANLDKIESGHYESVSDQKRLNVGKEIRRQELADQDSANIAMVNATERGYKAKQDAMFIAQAQEIRQFGGTGDQLLSLQKKQMAERLSLQREENDAIQEMDQELARKKMALRDLAGVNVLRQGHMMFAAEIQAMKNQRDERNKAIQDEQKKADTEHPERKEKNAAKAAADQAANEDEANQRIREAKEGHARQVENIEWDTKQQQLETTDRFNVMMLRAGHKFYEADKAEIENHLKEKTAAIQAEADRAIAVDKTNAKQIQAQADAKKQAATLDAAASMKELRDQRLRESLSLALPQGGVSGHLTGAQAISREMNNPGRGMLASLAKEKPPTREQTDKTNGLLEKLVYAMTHNVGGTVESLLGQSYGGN